MLSQGVWEVAKNVSKNSFPYSADVKHTVNKNQSDFIFWLHLACSVYVYTTI